MNCFFLTFQAMLPVFLYVLDVNDNAPAFEGTPYIATIAEVNNI